MYTTSCLISSRVDNWFGKAACGRPFGTVSFGLRHIHREQILIVVEGLQRSFLLLWYARAEWDGNGSLWRWKGRMLKCASREISPVAECKKRGKETGQKWDQKRPWREQKGVARWLLSLDSQLKKVYEYRTKISLDAPVREWRPDVGPPKNLGCT